MKKVLFVFAAAACMVACNKPAEATEEAQDTVVVEEVLADTVEVEEVADSVEVVEAEAEVVAE